METAATWLVLGILVVVAAAGLWVRRRAGHGGRSADTQEAATSVEEASGARTLLAVLTSESGDVRWDVEVAPASALKEGSWVDAPSDLAVEVARTLPEVAARNRLGDGSLVRLVNVSADELVEAKDGYRLGWARGRGGTAVRQARMEKVKAPPIISPGMVWAAASIVVGAHWQRVLSEQLEAIQTAVSGIRDVLDTQMNATLVAAMQRLREITALRGQRIDQALESDPRFADAETVFRTQLDLVEKRLQARPALTKHGGLRFADFETWLEGGPGDPGVVDLYASALRGFAVSLAYDQLRFEAHVAVGQAARAEVVLAHAEERASRMQRLTDELGDLLDSDSHPVEPPRSAPVIGAGKAERRRQRVAELTEQGQKLIDHTAQLLDAAGSAERELLVTGDGRVLARAPAPVTSPEAHAGRRSASPEAHAGRPSAPPVDAGAAERDPSPRSTEREA